MVVFLVWNDIKCNAKQGFALQVGFHLICVYYLNNRAGQLSAIITTPLLCPQNGSPKCPFVEVLSNLYFLPILKKTQGEDESSGILNAWALLSAFDSSTEAGRTFANWAQTQWIEQGKMKATFHTCACFCGHNFILRRKHAFVVCHQRRIMSMLLWIQIKYENRIEKNWFWT